ncbi:hypothetical protein [Actinocorallia sp. A-T 12471]|uniref:hypothetical protein n=1 Tax=Actinocorallia sp. A-T 12471 TaxID=3089813 RepID=UPI0029D29B0E|nr:hypothetical protein [Actinocorallia sp. A-T 12471]MDX6738375.1 hypothetical protein [Actinocorallia sp. A-T 12471]
MSYGYSPQDPSSYGYGIPGHPNQYGGQYGNPYGGYGPPPPPASNGPGVWALVANCVVTLFCCNILAIPGIITAAIALSKYQTDPMSARRLTTASWIIFAVAMVAAALLVFAFIAFADSSTYDTYFEDSGQRV